MKTIVLLCVSYITTSLFVYSQTYDPQAAASYSNNWWNAKNPQYNTAYVYNCANFVSQCLIAGGLNLTTGTDGKGTGVDAWDCIPGVQNLVTHLRKYQNTDYYYSQDVKTNVFSETDLGDPIFIGNPSENYHHSLFCSAVRGSQNFYNSQSQYHYQQLVTFWGEPYAHFFHIKSSIPAHCSNCVQDGDETEIDCGGSCPPCQKAQKDVYYTKTTYRLPPITNAINSIVAGNAIVLVLAGQDVTFNSTGTITLKPGFHVEKGGNFHATQKSMRKDITADCNDYCTPVRPTIACKEYAPFCYGWDGVANVSSIEIIIYQQCRSNLITIYESTVPVYHDGFVALWDLTTGRKTCNMDDKDYVFYYDAYVTDCKGNKYKYDGTITIAFATGCRKSLSHTSDSIENEADYPANSAWAIYPNPNEGSFTIAQTETEKIQQIEVLNMLGQVVYSATNPTSNNIELPPNAKGIFAVRITTQTNCIIRKIHVQ
jgi:hypothetical protein